MTFKMVDQACVKCTFSAICLCDGGSLDALINRLLTDRIDKFMKSGADAQTEYEQDALQNLAAKLAADGVRELLEQRVPAECPMLRRHDANGVELDWYDE